MKSKWKPYSSRNFLKSIKKIFLINFHVYYFMISKIFRIGPFLVKLEKEVKKNHFQTKFFLSVECETYANLRMKVSRKSSSAKICFYFHRELDVTILVSEPKMLKIGKLYMGNDCS